MTQPLRRSPSEYAPNPSKKIKNPYAARINAVCKAVVSNLAFYATFILDIVFLALIVRGGYTLVMISFFCVTFAIECIALILLLPVPLLQVGVVKHNILLWIAFSFAAVIEFAWTISMSSFGGGGVFGMFVAARILLWLCAFFFSRLGRASLPVLLLGIALALVALCGAKAVFSFSFSSRPLRFAYSEGTDNYGAGYVVTSVMYSTKNNVKIPATYKGKPVVAVQTGNNEIVCMQDLVIPASVQYVEMSAIHLENLTLQGDDTVFSDEMFYCPSLRLLKFAGTELPDKLPEFYGYIPDIALPRDKMDEAFAREDFADLRENIVPAVGDDEGYIVYHTDYAQPEDNEALELFTQPVQIMQGNGEQVLPAPDLTEKGYAFDGWYTDRYYRDKLERVSANGGYKLYARYYRLYTVELYASRYDDTPTDSFTYHRGNFADGNEVRMPTGGRWERDGYYFGGWYDKQYTYEAFRGGDTVKLRSDVMRDQAFYAEYKKLYNITVHDDGGSGYGTVPATFHEWTYGYDIPDAKKNGYTFMGWYTDAAFTQPLNGMPPVDDYGYVVKHDVDVYAKFNENYSITYVGGHTMPSDAPTYYHKDSVMVRMPTPTRKGYIFRGWYTNVYHTGSTVSYLPTNEEKDLMFYAKWEPIKYTVRYDKGDYWDVTGSMPDDTFTYDQTDQLAFCTYEKTGYSFAGWKIDDRVYNEGTYSNFNFTETNGAVVMAYAQWRAHEFTLEFVPDCDDATGEMADIQSAYKSYVTLPPCGFTREGYEFSHWSIRGTACEAGTSQCMAWECMEEDGATVKVLAVWKKIQE